MKTRNSVDLRECDEMCWAAEKGDCEIGVNAPECGTWICPFYKPTGCEDWVRVEEGERCDLVPPEEYKARRAAEAAPRNVTFWRLTAGRA